MAIDEEVEKVLDEHGNRIKGLETDMSEIKIAVGRSDERLKNIENNQKDQKQDMIRIENAILQGNSALLNAVMNKDNNNTQKEISEDNNKTKKHTNKINLLIQLLINLGIIVGGYFAMKK